jgi:hypothetical protein
MTGDWTPLAWLAVLLVPLFVLTRWLSRHLQGVGLLFSGDQQTALLAHYLALLPGILLHELSHVLAAQLVGVKIRGLSLRPKARRGGSVRFGAVTVTKTDPFRESWIGLAPLLTGTAAILVLAHLQFGVESLPALRLDAVRQVLSNSLRAPDALIWLYLIFAISNAMWPSESDRQPWRPVFLFLALIAATLFLSGMVPQVLAELERWVLTAVTYLTFAFALAVIVDMPVALSLFVVEKVGERLLHRHVEY